MNLSRRQLLQASAALLVDNWTGAHRAAFAEEPARITDRKVVVVACGGMRRSDTFSPTGFHNIPHLYRDILPRGVFYPFVRNEGVTSHYNTLSSMVTGNWQRLDDWGRTAPASPTIFEHLRKQRGAAQDQTWFISSNKALTSKIGASTVSEFGPSFGANVLFPKQLLINAVVHAAAQGRAVHGTDRASMQPEIEAMLAADSYDGLGWSVFGESALDSSTTLVIDQAVKNLLLTNDPVTGDEFTFLVAQEVMRRFGPSMLVITFSDMEVAHFGSYSLYLAGIRTVDRLVFEIWNSIQLLPAYKDNTTLFITPEFGRDLDGSATNGFFNHRQDAESTRETWMMCMGEAASNAQIVEQPMTHLHLFPTLARLLDLKGLEMPQMPLPGLSL